MSSTDIEATNNQRTGDSAIQHPSYPRPDAIVVVELNSKAIWLGNIDSDNPETIVRRRLNPRAENSHFFGFKVLFRCDLERHQSHKNVVYEHISLTINPSCCRISHRAVGSVEQMELMNVAPGAQMSINQESYRIEFVPLYGRQAFLFDRLEISPPRTSNPLIRERYNALMRINDASKVVLFVRKLRTTLFDIDDMLNENTLQTRLNKFTFVKYPMLQPISNWQMQMVAGMADMPNKIFYDSRLIDGRGTSLDSRPLAREFKKLIRSIYPQLRREPPMSAYPIFLNVLNGTCRKNGDAMENYKNVGAGCFIIELMLARPAIGKAAIGIITSCPGQIRPYQVTLRMLHTQEPTIGYDKISIMTSSQMQKTEMDFVIFDMVQTDCIENPTERILETNLLQQALTVHRDGLIVIGRLAESPNETKSPTTLPEKGHDTFCHVFKWFCDHDRVVNVPRNDPQSGSVSSLGPTTQEMERPQYQMRTLPELGQDQTNRKGQKDRRKLTGYRKQQAAKGIRKISQTQPMSTKGLNRRGSPSRSGVRGFFPDGSGSPVTDSESHLEVNRFLATIELGPSTQLPFVESEPQPKIAAERPFDADFSNIRMLAIRKAYARLHDPETAPRDEMLLFERLSEAYIHKDRAGFDACYLQLLRNAQLED